MDYIKSIMITVVELPEFIRRSKKMLNEKKRENIIDYLASHPASGVIIQGTGGIRKLRWKREGSGKSGGVRIIYYYHNESYPVFLLTLFGKSEKANLSKAQRNKLAQLVQILIRSYSRPL